MIYTSNILVRTIGIYSNLTMDNNSSMSKYDHKFLCLERIWTELINYFDNFDVSNVTKYSIIGAKNHFMGSLGICSNEKYTNRCAGFRFSIHLKIMITESSMFNLMFFIDSGACNVTGLIEAEHIVESMKRLTIFLSKPLCLQKDIYFFIKTHMNKTNIEIKDEYKYIHYENLKNVLESDACGYRLIKHVNNASTVIKCDLPIEAYDLYVLKYPLKDSLKDPNLEECLNKWIYTSETLDSINRKYEVNASKLKKELININKEQNVPYIVKINFQLIKKKIIICSKRIDASELVAEEIIDILSHNIDKIFI